MRRNALIYLTLSGLALAAPGKTYPQAGQSPPSGQQSFESCSLITGEYLTVLQLLSRGLSPDTLKQSLPAISPQAKGRIDKLVAMASRDGLIDTYSTINSDYAQCARRVFAARGLPPQGSREAHFHRCAGENKVGYEIAVAALVGAPQNQVRRQLDPRHGTAVQSIYRELEAEGKLGMFDRLATVLKRCLGAIP